MKSKMFTKKSLITIALTIFILIGFSIVANETIVKSRIAATDYQKEYASKTSADGQFIIGFAPDENGNKNGMISRFQGGDYRLKVANTPYEYNGIKITKITEEAYCGFDTLEEVIIPQTIASIGNNAFSGCKNLKKVYIPASVTEISSNAFSDLGNDDFMVYVEKKSYAEKFAKENKLNFANYTPSPLESKKDVDYSKTVFGEQYKNFNYDIIYYNDIPFCTIESFNAQANELKDLTFPQQINGVDVTIIMDNVICSCSSLETITLPETVTYVGNNAFTQCPELKMVYFPKSVTTIGDSIFKDSPNAVICAPKDSYANKYAIDNNIHFEEWKNE